MKRKKIGVEYTALGAYILARFLEQNDMSVEEIVLVPIEVDRHEAAYLSGEVDAVITFEPVKTILQKRGARILFDSSLIPGEIIDVLVVRRSLYERNRQKIKILTRAWYKVIHEIDTEFDATAELMFPHLKLTKKELQNAYRDITLGDQKINNEMLRGAKPKIGLIIEKLYQVMKKNKIVSNDVRPEELY